MNYPDPRPPLLPPFLLGRAKVVLGLFAAGLAVAGGLLTFFVAGKDLVQAAGYLLGMMPLVTEAERATASGDLAIVAVVKSVDALLLGLVQFLLAAFLWQILDPKESLLDEENLERLEEAKQILCKVVLVIVAVRMLSKIVTPDSLQWEHLLFPAGIVALSLATNSLAKSGKPPAAKG